MNFIKKRKEPGRRSYKISPAFRQQKDSPLMCLKVNISNSRRQVVNKNISPKVSPIEKYSKELFKLSKGNGETAIKHALRIILKKGKMWQSQEDISLYLGVSRKSINQVMKKAVNLKILRKQKGTQFWDNRKRGIDTYFLGSACFDLDKLKAIVKIFPILENYLQNYQDLMVKKGLQPSRKLGVTALKSYLNLNLSSLSPNSSPIYEKERARVRRKVCEKWTPPPGEKLSTKLVKKTDEEIAIEQDNLVKFFRENKFSKFLPPDVVNSLTNRATSSIASHKYV